ncbi:LuxR family transcriptional regulator [Streptomyces sp. 3MP-14]|uniref:LuxR family transcriptional regulator n=1 Tax=Streptomyces mimosae TaxID=2586635 RepID=A0A5N6AJA4_9ACTN|nr:MULTISPECIES: LuxR C-terminal-related transcriptional regulator [Streptomyces]KAB8168744.1 LuxR family transcriptional regulator [Streptomyces mimosae]KAB8177976.1 LuxR family transcriptional regulator [Streptomyces sp. 3MP-14]
MDAGANEETDTGPAGPERLLTGVVDLLRAPLPEVLGRLSKVLAGVVPHHTLLLLTGDCAASALKWHGDATLTGPGALAELRRLAEEVAMDEPCFDRAALGPAGERHPVLAVPARPSGSAGALLAVVLDEDRAAPPTRARARIAWLLWQLTSVHIATLNARMEPAKLGVGRAVADERARLAAELTDAQAMALTTVLGALRSRALTDAAARATATDLAAAALVELRAGERGPDAAGPAESVADVFSRLADKLVLLMRHNDVRLELGEPDEPARLLPAPVAGAAYATVRGAVLTMLEQPGLGRVRVAWTVNGGTLRLSVRDDGPGELTTDHPGIRRLVEGLAALDAELTLDAVPGWGSTLVVSLPLASAERPRPRPPASLNPRELDVLRLLSSGHRNRRIAELLHISEHTVKFHVANILDKLDVASRGEAAAAARSFGLVEEGAPFA